MKTTRKFYVEWKTRFGWVRLGDSEPSLRDAIKRPAVVGFPRRIVEVSTTEKIHKV